MSSRRSGVGAVALVTLVATAALVMGCESIGVGVGIGIPVGSRGGVGVSVGGTIPLPAKPPQAPASAASAP